METAPCPLCKSICWDGYGQTRSWFSRYLSPAFHDVCAFCDDYNDQTVHLCSVCKHMRPWHLIRCAKNFLRDRPDPRSFYNITVGLGTFREVQARPDCRICEAIYRVICLRWHPYSSQPDLWDRYTVWMRIKFKGNLWEGFFVELRRTDGELHVRELPLEVPFHFTKHCGAHAEVLDSFAEKPLDWSLVKRWLKTCTQGALRDHDCEPPILHVPPNEFRVIDVANERVIRAPSRCEYITLSYVWGETDAEDLQARTENVQQLSYVRSLSNFRLPRTIKDAMVVCRMLGKSYLWVDRLCIVQDDETSKHDQINRMADIYSSAFLTIVAADGADPNYGLPGVSTQPRSRAPFIFRLMGLEMTETISNPFTEDVYPKWQTRGWTYQEAVSSSRVLAFTDSQVCYDCVSQRNSMLFEFKTRSYWHVSGSLIDHYALFPMMIENFSKRDLTFESDTYLAFSGIMFRKHGNNHQFGMPWSNFDFLVHWRPASWDSLSRRWDSTRKVLFPSWSWASLNGPVNFDLDPDSIFPMNYVMVASWAYCNTVDGDREWIKMIPQNSDEKLFDDAEGWSILAWKRGFFKPELPAKIEELSPSHREFWEMTRTEHHCDGRRWNFLDEFSKDQLCAAATPGRLLLFTQVARLRLEYVKTTRVKGRRTFFLWTMDERWIGVVHLTTYQAQHIINTLDSGQVYIADVAALSICHWDWHGPRILRDTLDRFVFDPQRGKIGTAYESHDKIDFNGHKALIDEVTKFDAKGLVLVLNIMLLGWCGNVARRLGLGQAWCQRWRKSNPSFKTVVLE